VAVHIVCFNVSAISSIAQLPQIKKEPESIVPLWDDLSFGPIEDVCSQERQLWRADFLKSCHDYSHSEISQIWISNIKQWEFVKSGPADLQVWLNCNSTSELCGFGEFISQLPQNHRFEIVDFANQSSQTSNDSSAGYSIGRLSTTQLDAGLLLRRQSQTTEWLPLIEQWKKVKLEGEYLRTSQSNLPHSTIETHFDQTFFMYVTPEWRKTDRVILDVLLKLEEEGYSASWDALYWRIIEITRRGIFEIMRQEHNPLGRVRLCLK
jgi:Protein of unknown function/Domain of unknown function (DUF1835)